MMQESQATRLLWASLTSLAVVALWVLLTEPGLAQATGNASSGFRCVGGRASGSLYDSGGSCPVTLSFGNIFSFLVCNFEKLSSDLMGNMFCGMVLNLRPMVLGVVTLAVMFFGIGFTVGVIPATAREYQKFLIKMAFTAAFATQADYIIGIGYRFLVGGAREGIAITLAGLNGETNTTGAALYAHLDNFLSKVVRFGTDYIGGKWDGTNNPCQNAIFAAMAIMAIAFPPIFYIGLLIIVRIAMTFFRAVFGYIYAIVGIAFLLSLSPFFLSFSLFQQTRNLFEKWLGYLSSFALQMIFVFAFLSFIVSINVQNISGSLVNIVMPVQETYETSTFRLPWKYCTVCEFKVIDSSTQAEIPQEQYDSFLNKGALVCKDNPPKPIRVLSMAAPPDQQAPNAAVQNALLKFASTGLISLLVLAYLIDGLLSLIPQIAQNIAGGMNGVYAAQLGGGEAIYGRSKVSFPGEGLVDSFGRGFDSGFGDRTDIYGNKLGGDSLSRTTEGLKRGMARMITGRDGGLATDQDRVQERYKRPGRDDHGVVGGIGNFLINPHGDKAE